MGFLSKFGKSDKNLNQSTTASDASQGNNVNQGIPTNVPKKKKSFFIKKKKKEKTEDSGPMLDEFSTNNVQKKEQKAPDRPLIKYRYVIVNAMGKKENGTFEAENETEVRNFLLSQDYEVVSIKVRPSYDIDINDHAKMKVSDLSFALTQLSTYIKSGIP